MYKRLIFLALLLALPLASATYISGKVEILPDGRISFNLDTDVKINVADLTFKENKIFGTTGALTKKDGELWTFDLTQLPEYDEVFLEIRLPKNLKEIVRIKGLNNVIDLEKKVIFLIGSGKPGLSMQYTLGNYVSYSKIVWPLLAILFIILFILYKKNKRKKERLGFIMPLINENEQRIVELLMKTPMRQKEIRNHLKIPKASFSRYILNLERKKIIYREGEGKNKVVRLR